MKTFFHCEAITHLVIPHYIANVWISFFLYSCMCIYKELGAFKYSKTWNVI